MLVQQHFSYFVTECYMKWQYRIKIPSHFCSVEEQVLDSQQREMYLDETIVVN
jgi:hypothetical protein